MTQTFESWADAMGLDELSSEHGWAEKAWQAALRQAIAQPAQVPALTDARIEQINDEVFQLARGLSQTEYMRIFARAIEKEIRG